MKPTQLIEPEIGYRQPWPAALAMAAVILSIALAARQLAAIPDIHHLGIGALPLSILLGMILAAFPRTGQLAAKPAGAKVQHFAQKTLLQIGIVLFGFQLSFSDLLAVGWQALVADMATILVVLPVGIWLGHRVLKIPLALSVLMAVGSAVCGAAAILAAAPVLGKYQVHDGDSEEGMQAVGIAVAAVALFGTFSVLLYPLAQHVFGLSDASTGIYIGSTIHEVAQALAATDTLSSTTQHNAVIVKLMRVVMLAPVLIALAVWLQERDDGEGGERHKHRLTVPGFVLLFLAVVILNSLLPGWLAPEMLGKVRAAGAGVSAICLALAMAALGLNIRWAAFRASGWQPLLLGATLWGLLLVGGGLICRLLFGLFPLVGS